MTDWLINWRGSVVRLSDRLIERWPLVSPLTYGGCAWWYAATGRPPGWKFR